MKREINMEAFAKKVKLFVATPMYGGQCSGMFAKSISDLAAFCARYGVDFRFYALFNESLITRARNYCADEFMRSGCTHLMFIDSDIAFNPIDVIALAELADDESEYDVIAGAYPKKNISWEKIKLAVDQGAADDNPFALEQYVGDFVFNPVGGTKSIPLDQPAEVAEAGTGFMMIRRETLEKFDEAYPEKRYKPDHVRSASFDGSREITAYFTTEIEKKSKRYLSEDYNFCHMTRDAGMKVWLCPWMQLKHMGSYVFGGSLGALASINAVATADAKQIGEKGKK